MSYHLRPQRKAGKEILRVTRKRLKKARAALNTPETERALGIHKARKRLKETRAVLRLVAGHLGKRFASDNRRLRDIARLLSASRDVTAVVESWDALTAAEAELLLDVARDDVRQRLASRKGGGIGTEEEALAEALASLRSFETDMKHWSLHESGFGLYAEGLESSYRQGRKALAKAEKTPSAHNLHEWRKRVKDHWYHTRLLTLAWPEHLQQRGALLKELSEMLGDEHDLSMLWLLKDEEPDLFGDEGSRLTIEEAITRRRRHLQSSALRLGHRLYAESPKALRKRFEKYWQISRGDSQGRDKKRA